RDEYFARRIFTEVVPAPKAMVNSAYFANSVVVNVCVPVPLVQPTRDISDDKLPGAAAIRIKQVTAGKSGRNLC
ncbi:hypothetical protein AB9F34_34670, partial [Rhizobium leguminosarum]